MADPATAPGVRGRYRLLYKLATEDGYTVRQLIKVVSSSGGHLRVVGSGADAVGEGDVVTAGRHQASVRPALNDRGEIVAHDLTVRL